MWPSAAGDRSRQDSDLLHHRFGVSLGRNGGEHEVSPGRQASAIPEVRVGDNAPTTGWLAWSGRAEPERDIRDGTVRPGRGGIGLDKHRPLVVIGDVEHRAGEVVVRGPNVVRGYLRRPDESAQVLRGGWLDTGDVGRFDDDGYLTLVDRVKDLIIRGGENLVQGDRGRPLHPPFLLS